MRCSRQLRVLCLVLLAAWVAPGAVAVAMSVHLFLHHGAEEHGHDADHSHHAVALAELAEIVEHGHSHGLSESPHSHVATTRQSALLLAQPGGAPAERAARTLLPSLQIAPSPAAPASAAPRPLFSLHCALLR